MCYVVGCSALPAPSSTSTVHLAHQLSVQVDGTIPGIVDG